MKNVETFSLQGPLIRRQGWVTKLGVLAGAAVLCTALLIPSFASAQPTPMLVTHLDLLKFLVDQAGDESFFRPDADFDDYKKWAEKAKVKPKGGFQEDKIVTMDFYAEVLVDFFRLKPEKMGKDYVAILEREGIFVPDTPLITKEGLVSVTDDFGFQSRLAVFAHGICSPVKGKKHKFTVDKCTPPPVPKKAKKPKKVKVKKG